MQKKKAEHEAFKRKRKEANYQKRVIEESILQDIEILEVMFVWMLKSRSVIRVKRRMTPSYNVQTATEDFISNVSKMK